MPDYRQFGVYGLAGYRTPYWGTMPFAGIECFDPGVRTFNSTSAGVDELDDSTSRAAGSKARGDDTDDARKDAGEHVIGHDAHALGLGVLHGVDHSGLPDIEQAK